VESIADKFVVRLSVCPSVRLSVLFKYATAEAHTLQKHHTYCNIKLSVAPESSLAAVRAQFEFRCFFSEREARSCESELKGPLRFSCL